MLSVRTAVALLLGIIALLLLTLGVLSSQQMQTAARQAEAENRRHESIRLAEAMRQSSDQLTMMVRLYVSTGEPKYREYFEEILAIRNGTAPRPQHYDGSFWDRVLSHGKEGVEYGPAKSLPELMREAHFTTAEFDALSASKEASDELAKIEITVMAHVEKRIQAGVDAQYINDVYADYLHLVDAGYLSNKDRIMAAVERFEVLVDTRTLSEVEAQRQRSARLVDLQIVFLLLLLAASIAAFLLAERGLTRPLRDLMSVTRRIAGGDYAQRVGRYVLMELNRLGQTFNEMAAAIQSDVARRERAETQAQAARRAAESANHAKSDFLANMSHEIRTPLNAIIGMSELLGDTEMDKEQRDGLATIGNSGAHLLGIINDILDFSKIEAGMLDLDVQVFDLRHCLEGAMELVAGRAAEKHLDLAMEIVPGTPEILRGDPQRLRQILVNLVSNAIKFTAHGEVVVTASSSQAGAEGHRFDFVVRDTGIGIPAERMDRLFKSFSQVDTSTTRTYGGTGLGLAISKRLAEMMGGAISVDSTPGAGSTFRFSIHADVPAEGPGALPGDREDFRSQRVLLVDDNDTNRRILRSTLERWGMHVTDTASPQQALDWLAQGERYEVAIIDYLMPGMDGRMLAQAIRARPETRDLPLIMASTTHLTRRQAPEFDAIIAKPLRRSMLLDTLMEVLSGGAWEGASSAAETSKAGRASSLRVLVAEDNEVNQKVVLRMLGSLGYQADLAGNGSEAVAAVRSRAYDVVLMDVHMPVMDGLEAARRIRADPEVRQPRIFAMTASALDSERQECLDAGMERHVAKPVQRRALAAALELVAPAAGPAAAATPESATAATEADLVAALDAQVDELSAEGVAELLDSVLRDGHAGADRLVTALDARDFPKLRRLAHTLKANAAMVGARRLSDQLQDLEYRCGAGGLEGIEAMAIAAAADYRILMGLLGAIRPRYPG